MKQDDMPEVIYANRLTSGELYGMEMPENERDTAYVLESRYDALEAAAREYLESDTRSHLTHPDGYCEGCGDTPCLQQKLSEVLDG